MSKVKIATIRFDESIQHIHIAYETILAHSVVCVVNDNNESKVYTNQNVPFAEGNPWVFGIAQHNAEPGQIVEVQYSGMSKVRFFSRNIPVNTNIFLQKNSNGVCCLSNENGIETFKKDNGDSIMCGFIPPRTQPIMGSTREPREMLVDAWIHITTIPAPEVNFQINYRIYYNEPPIPPYNLVLISSNPPQNYLFSYKRPIKDDQDKLIGTGTYQITINSVEISANNTTGQMMGDFTAHHQFSKENSNYDIYLNGSIILKLGLRFGQTSIDPLNPFQFIITNELDTINATSIFLNSEKINYGNNSLKITNGYQYTIEGVSSSNKSINS